MNEREPSWLSALGRTPEELLIALAGLVVVGGGILASLDTRVSGLLGWLLSRDIVVPATADPVVIIPGADGAGLDLPWLAISAGALVIALAVVVDALVHAIRRRKRERDLT
jgi:hypothetical protein